MEKRIALKVEWLDCSSWGDAWMSYEKAKELNIDPIISRGTVINETPTTIFLAQSESHDLCHNIIGIPKGGILNKRKIP